MDPTTITRALDLMEELIMSQSPENGSASEVLTKLGSPIVSIAILEHGKITSQVFGISMPQKDKNAPATTKTYNEETLFQAASISKPMTALAVMKFCDQGVLSLQAPISTYLSQEQLSWLSTPKTIGLVSQVTLSQLLSHTSGISCIHGFGGYSQFTIPNLEQILRGEYPANNPPVKLQTFPGQKFYYSGGGYTVVQLILEAFLKKPFPQIMEELILKPLQMLRSTFITQLPGGEKNYAPVFLTGKNKSEPGYYLFPEGAACGLWTTPSDLLRVIRAIQESLEKDVFIGKDWAQCMLTEIEDKKVALGWFTDKESNHFAHNGGNDPGYRCFVGGYKDFIPSTATDKSEIDESKFKKNVLRGCGVSIMTSSPLGEIVQDKILAAITYLKGWPSMLGEPVIPFIDFSKQVDERAKEWFGKWGPGQWILAQGSGSGSGSGYTVTWNSLPAVALLPGAISPRNYPEGDSIDLAADGLDMMLRLGWDAGQRVVEIWQEGEMTLLTKQVVVNKENL